MILKINYSTSKEDYINYLLHHNWRSPERIRLRLTIHLLLLIAYLGVTFSMFAQPLYSWNNIILVSVGLFIQALIPILMERRIAKAAAQKFDSTYPQGFPPTTLQLTEDTLSLIKQNNPNDILDIWVGKVANLEEFEDLLVIHATETTLMIAQRHFENRAAYETFVETLWERSTRARNLDADN